MPDAILYPNAPGDLTEIDMLVGAATHWQAVLTNDGYTSYIETFLANQTQRDLYELDNLPAGVGIITNVAVCNVNGRTIAGSVYAYGAQMLKTGGTVYVLGECRVWFPWRTDSQSWETNPKTGLAWTHSEVNSLQAGVRLRSTNPTPMTRPACTQVYVVVTYDPVTEAEVTTNPATGIGTKATLNGTLDDDGGEACDCGFEWGETEAYGNITPTQSRVTGQTFAQAISGLRPYITYHFRAFANNWVGIRYGVDRTFVNLPGVETAYGADRTFITLLAVATVTTDPASDVSAISATLNGTFDHDGGEACNCGFEWGETDAYGNATPTQSRTTGQTFAQTISGLDPNKTYHFRSVATNGAGTTYGADRSFTTLVALSSVTTDPASAISAISATINGTLDHDGGEACNCGFEWGLDTGYGTNTSLESKTLGETLSQVLGGLQHTTHYHYRAFATNSMGTGYGADRIFLTKQIINKAYAFGRHEL